MLDDIVDQKDNISFVLVFKLSRFGRNAADVLKSMQTLMDYGVDLVCVDDAIDSSTAGGRLTLTILSAVAEIERENINVQFQAGRMQKVLDGGWPGGPTPYGYRNVKKSLVIEPEEAEMVKRIYDLFLRDGMNTTSVAIYLNEHGYRKSSREECGPFTYDSIRRILKNPVYCGRIMFNRRSSCKSSGRIPKEVLCVQGKHEALVTEEQWEAVQRKREQLSIPRGKVDDPEWISLLTGLIKCPKCGAGMVMRKNKKVNKNHGGYYKILYSYGCVNYRKANGRTCDFNTIYHQERTDNAVFEIVSGLTMLPEFRAKVMEQLGDQDSAEAIEEKLKELRKLLRKEERQKRKLGEDLDNLDILDESYDKKYDRIQAEIEKVYDRMDALESEVERISKKLSAVRRGIQAADNVMALLDHMKRLYGHMTCEEKREMYRLIIDRIEVWPKNEEGKIIKSISFKFPVIYGEWETVPMEKADEHVEFFLDCSGQELTVAEAPYGYRIDSKSSTLVVEPGEAEIVRIIYDKFAHTDMGFETISDYLNKHGYMKSKCRDQELSYFSRGLIRNVLDNPVYIGKITYGKNKNERVKGTRDEYRRVKSDDYMITDGKHEPIIDEQLWQEVREKRKATGIKWDKTHSLDHEHLLSGIVKCPVCGTGLSGTVRRRHNKKSGDYVDNFYYRCQHRKKIDDEHFCDYRPSLDQNELNHEVELLIMDMVSLDGFNDFIFQRMNEKVDVSALETEREQLRRQMTQVSGAKTKLNQMLDQLDVTDKHYERKYQDMQERLNNLYDQVGEINESIEDINEKISRAYEEQITAKQLCQILIHFDKVYFKMSDPEKKEFLRNLIESIELYPEKQDNGRIIKRVEFKFPVFYEGAEKGGIRLLNENTVETVVQLSKGEINSRKVRVEFSLEDMDMSGFQKGATYGQIKDYVKEHTGLSVSSLYIAQIKQKYGIIERECYNKPKSENDRQPQCPPEKEAAITEALRWFKMIE